MTTTPTQGRTNTEFDVARYVGREGTPWRSVHSLFELPLVQPTTGVPKDLINEGGLVGVKDVTAQFIELFHSTSKPIWIFGDGGIGKTALVADALLKIEQQATVTIIWMDMASVGPTEADFVEELLLLLAKARALAEPPDVQWSIVEKIFSTEQSAETEPQTTGGRRRVR